MKQIKIGNVDQAFVVDKSNTTYILEKGKEINADIIAMVSEGTPKNVHIEIDGRVDAPSAIRWGTMDQPGKAMDMSVGASGRVLADYMGIEFFGNGHSLENAGRVVATLGVYATGQDFELENSGLIKTDKIGVYAQSFAHIGNTGTIESGERGIVLASIDNFQGATVINHGKIIADVGVEGSAGADRVVNSGKITGDIELRAGEDTFQFNGGKVGGHVAGGDGNDLFILRKAGIDIVEIAEEGYDTVKSYVSHTLHDQVEELLLKGRNDIDGVGNGGDNRIHGNSGDNRLMGGNGFDTLTGGAGRDVLTGGLDGDTFVFLRGSGKDIVTDFEIGSDEIDLGALKGVKDFEDMMEHHVADKNGDLWITYGKDVVVLQHIASADLKSEDFTF